MKFNKFFAACFVFVSVSALADDETRMSTYSAPPELFCNINTAGSSLTCQYFDGKDTKALTDADVPNFVDRAAVDAYITIKSKRGAERTFFIDPNAPAFKKLAEMRRAASVSEIIRAKLDIFADIEKRAIKSSNDMDANLGNVELVKTDSSITNSKLKKQITYLSAELSNTKGAADASSKAAASCATTNDLAMMQQDNRLLSQYLTSVLLSFQNPDSCLGDVKLKVGADGSVDISQIDLYAKLFAKYCTRSGKVAITQSEVEKTKIDLAKAKAMRAKGELAGAAVSGTPVAAMPAPVTTTSIPSSGGSSALEMLLARNGGKAEVDPDATECDAKYLQGPFVIAGPACGTTSLCYGLARCGTKGGAKQNTRITCESTVSGDMNYCLPPGECLKTKQVMLFSKNIKVSASKFAR